MKFASSPFNLSMVGAMVATAISLNSDTVASYKVYAYNNCGYKVYPSFTYDGSYHSGGTIKAYGCQEVADVSSISFGYEPDTNMENPYFQNGVSCNDIGHGNDHRCPNHQIEDTACVLELCW